jgi:hypothetical protein
MKTGVQIIAEERKRQIEVEGWTFDHDDLHKQEELAGAAMVYASSQQQRFFISSHGDDYMLNFWPFELKYLKFSPHDRIRELAKSGALIAAEIDRLQREKVRNLTTS